MVRRTGGGEEAVAGAGLLHRRALVGLGVAAPFAGVARAQPTPTGMPPSMLKPGAMFSEYGTPSAQQANVKRLLPSGNFPGVGSARTPLQRLEGIVTPSGLHFERHHNGVPQIDAGQHRLLIHGLVRRPLAFTLEALLRYPMESRIRFIECGGNSGGNARPEARQADVGALHGLLSCSEWSGVKLATLLDEAGLADGASWVIAEGADAAAMSRSVPLEKCLDDAIVALYQNGEAIRPEQGYPMRLLLPGWEGNMQIKWLHRLKVVRTPADSREETGHYTDLMRDGKARQFVFPVAVKSIIVKPSYGLNLKAPGLYEISGLAWTGSGRIARVEVSADGGKSWADAQLDGAVLPMALTRFRMPWRWDGGPATLLSRATDEAGAVQPTRAAWVAKFAPGSSYHFNGIQSWSVDRSGEVRNVYL